MLSVFSGIQSLLGALGRKQSSRRTPQDDRTDVKTEDQTESETRPNSKSAASGSARREPTSHGKVHFTAAGRFRLGLRPSAARAASRAEWGGDLRSTLYNI